MPIAKKPGRRHLKNRAVHVKNAARSSQHKILIWCCRGASGKKLHLPRRAGTVARGLQLCPHRVPTHMQYSLQFHLKGLFFSVHEQTPTFFPLPSFTNMSTLLLGVAYDMLALVLLQGPTVGIWMSILSLEAGYLPGCVGSKKAIVLLRLGFVVVLGFDVGPMQHKKCLIDVGRAFYRHGKC